MPVVLPGRAAAPPTGAPPSPWPVVVALVALAAGQAVLFWALGHWRPAPTAPSWLWPTALGALAFVGVAASAALVAAHLTQRRRHWEAALWRALRAGVSPTPQQSFSGPSGWTVEASFAPVSGPGAAWADFRQGPAESELAWLVASLPPAQGSVPSLVCRGAASAKWQSLGPGDLSEALRQVGQAALAPEGWAAWSARLEANSGALSFAGEGGMLAFTVDRRGRLGYLWGGAPPEGAPTSVDAGPIGQARLAEGSSMLVLDAALIHAPGPTGEAYGLGRLERLVRDRPGCDAQALSHLVVEALQRFHEGAPAPREGVVAVCRLVACGP